LFTYAPCSGLLCPETLKVAQRALALSLKSSLAATVLSFALGLPTALFLARARFRGQSLVNALVELPVSLPPLVLGVSLLLVWGRRGIFGQHLNAFGHPLSFTYEAVIIAQFVVASPFFVRIAKATIEQVPKSLEEASRTLGAGPLKTYWRVTLPLAKAGILSGLVTCWARCMSEFGATIMFAGNFPGRTQTIPLAIFSTMQNDVPSSVGLSVTMLCFSAASFVIAQACIARAAPQH
jgi:molybdate transport system permease protein